MADVVKSYEEVAGLGEEFRANVAGLKDMLDTIKSLEKERDAYKAAIRAALEDAKLTGVQVGPIKAILAKGRETTKLDVDKLQKNGVSLQVIKASTVTTIGEPSVRLFTQEV